VNFRLVSAAEVANYREPPTRVKMLVRDFIDDSLYNVGEKAASNGAHPRSLTMATFLKT
jgi:hypothetical protein